MSTAPASLASSLSRLIRCSITGNSRRLRFVSSKFRVAVSLLAVCAVTLVATACGGESSPSSPTPVASAPPASPTVTALRIDGADAIRAGSTSDYTVTATLSNGTTQAVTPTWSSSNTAIASVDSNGRVSAQSHGSITLTAAYQGSSSTKAVSSVANYAGRWSGAYVTKACDQSGVFQQVRYCQESGGVGSIGPIALSLAQGGANQSQLSGTISFGALTGNIAGNVTGDGRMVIGGSFNITSSGLTFTFTVGGWDSRLTGPSTMSGRWADNLVAVGVPGNVYSENELVTMTRTSVAVVPASAPRSITTEWREFFSAMRRPQ